MSNAAAVSVPVYTAHLSSGGRLIVSDELFEEVVGDSASLSSKRKRREDCDGPENTKNNHGERSSNFEMPRAPSHHPKNAEAPLPADSFEPPLVPFEAVEGEQRANGHTAAEVKL